MTVYKKVRELIRLRCEAVGIDPPDTNLLEFNTRTEPWHDLTGYLYGENGSQGASGGDEGDDEPD